MNFFCLHLGAYAVAKFFNALAVFVAHNVFKEGFNGSFRFFARVDVFVAPYGIFTAVCIFQRRFYAVDGQNIYALIIDEVRKRYVADRTRILSYALDEDTGVIRFEGLLSASSAPLIAYCLKRARVPEVFGRVTRTIGLSGPPTSFQFVTLAVKIS